VSAVASAFATLDATWFDHMLGASVVDAQWTPLTFTGATTDMARISLTYADAEADGGVDGEADGGVAGPASMIAKLRGRDEARRQMDAVMGLFAREAAFYRELASELPIRTPRALHIGDGDATPLLLEDLDGMRLGDQTEGLSVADAGHTLDALADLHARFWESPTLTAPWLLNTTDDAFKQIVTQMVTGGTPVLAERYGTTLGDAAVDQVLEAAPRWGEVLDRIAAGPHTLVHNDCRLDNLFFAADGVPVFIDWQLVAATRGSQDIGNLLAGSMEPADLSAHWRDLLGRYHERLLARGVKNYGFDECTLHYRQNIAWALGQGLALLGPLSGGDARGVGARIIRRALPHMQELESFDALEMS